MFLIRILQDNAIYTSPHGSALISMRIRIQLCTSMRSRPRATNQCGSVRITVRIRTLIRLSCHKQPFWEDENQVYLVILANFLAPGSGSQLPIRTRIQWSQINADPQHWRKLRKNWLLQLCDLYFMTVVNVPQVSDTQNLFIYLFLRHLESHRRKG
jgi:hypothetical protein